MDELLTDLRLEGEDLAETPTGDLDDISGAANVAQAAMRCLIRTPGELVWAPAYGAGLLNWIEQPNTPSFHDLAAQLGRRALLRDPRIAEVNLSATPSTTDDNAVTFTLEGYTSTGEFLSGFTTYGG